MLHDPRRAGLTFCTAALCQRVNGWSGTLSTARISTKAKCFETAFGGTLLLRAAQRPEVCCAGQSVSSLQVH